MATRTWQGGTGDWETASNWPGGVVPAAGDKVVLPAGSSAYTVSVSSYLENLSSLDVGSSGTRINPVTLQLNSAARIYTTGAINISDSSVIEGQGQIQANGGFAIISNDASTNPQILAGTASSGGTLDVKGAIANFIVVGFANTTIASTLKLEGAQNLKTIQIASSTQTLELAGGSNVAFALAVIASAGVIQVDKLATLTASNGLALFSGATLDVSGSATVNGAGVYANASTIQLNGATLTVGNGVSLVANSQLTGSGTLIGDISGAGSILAAAGGALILTKAVGNDNANVTSLVLGAGSSLLLTSTSGIGTSTFSPTVEFAGVATTEIFQAVNESIKDIYLGTIKSFGGGDFIKLGSFGADDKLTYNSGAHTVTISDSGGHNSRTFTFDGSTDVSQIMLDQATVNGVLADVLSICFMAGTRILTPEGEAPVETLSRGDLVLTAEGQARPVLWVGRQTIAARFVDPVRNWPIRIAAGALAENAPSRDLLVSPEHAVLVEEVLVNAGALVNGTSIRRESAVPESFVYYHVELEEHALILAENVPAETFVDNVDRRHFDNWAEHEALYPDGRGIAELPLPRAKAQRQLPASIRQALAVRAAALGLFEAA
ncbi:Hint domain-containing protein [uncultured Rhodoblastus sp.]|uniref:Hint domain-containing protein n=1 Tax=uncultured Rhodoblastus sp. TaxID=543037 RepID=UPI0025EACCCE|nr:Hint domain-containing protein [uncultured Rhodoblastus sp.]